MTHHQQALLKAVKMLAADHSLQQQYLHSLEVPVDADELALDFHDVAIAAPFMLQDKEITEQQNEYVKKIDEALNNMSGATNAALWDVEALSTAPEWAQIRNLSAELLRLLEADTDNFGSA